MANMIHNPANRPHFIDVLQRVKRKIVDRTSELNRQGSFGYISVCVMCRSGRHRSVCFASLLKWCLLFERFNVTGTLHVNSDEWGNLCKTCTRCGPCTWLKQSIRDAVLEVWRDI